MSDVPPRPVEPPPPPPEPVSAPQIPIEILPQILPEPQRNLAWERIALEQCIADMQDSAQQTKNLEQSIRPPESANQRKEFAFQAPERPDTGWERQATEQWAAETNTSAYQANTIEQSTRSESANQQRESSLQPDLFDPSQERRDTTSESQSLGEDFEHAVPPDRNLESPASPAPMQAGQEMAAPDRNADQHAGQSDGGASGPTDIHAREQRPTPRSPNDSAAEQSEGMPSAAPLISQFAATPQPQQPGQVQYLLEPKEQPTDWTCFHTCAVMLDEYRSQKSGVFHQPSEVERMLEPDSQKESAKIQPKANQYLLGSGPLVSDIERDVKNRFGDQKPTGLLSITDVYRLADRFDFTESPITDDPESFKRTLEQVGPFIYVGKVDPSIYAGAEDHAFLITGIEQRQDFFYVSYNDPADGQAHQAEFFEFITAHMPTLTQPGNDKTVVFHLKGSLTSSDAQTPGERQTQRGEQRGDIGRKPRAAERGVAESDGSPNTVEQSRFSADNGSQPQNTYQRIANSITGIFEGGKPGTLNLYDNGIISYGKHQATLKSGNLYLILKQFTKLSETVTAKKLKGYLRRVQNKDATLPTNTAFIKLLKDAAKEPAMTTAQENVFTEQFWNPATKAAQKAGLQSALGYALLYDTKIHGGMEIVLKRTVKQLGGVVGDIVRGTPISEQEFLRVFIEKRAQLLVGNSQQNKERARVLLKEAEKLPEIEANAKRQEAERMMRTAQMLRRSTTERRIPAWRALLESGNLNLYGDANGQLKVNLQYRNDKGKIKIREVSIMGLKPNATVDGHE